MSWRPSCGPPASHATFTTLRHGSWLSRAALAATCSLPAGEVGVTMRALKRGNGSDEVADPDPREPAEEVRAGAPLASQARTIRSAAPNGRPQVRFSPVSVP